MHVCQAEVPMYHKERDLGSEAKYLQSVSVECNCVRPETDHSRLHGDIQLSPSRVVYLDRFHFSVKAETY